MTILVIAILVIIPIGIFYTIISEENVGPNYITVQQVLPDKDVVIGYLRYPPDGVAVQLHTLVGENLEDHVFLGSLKVGDHIMQDAQGKWIKVQ